MEGKKRECMNCRFWVQDRDDEVGECHRHAPVPVPVQGAEERQARFVDWPQTLAGEFCGEHQPVPGTDS